MGKISVEHTVEINSPASKTWTIVGPGFINIAAWGSAILKSWENETITTRINNAPVGGRLCEVKGFGTMDEQIIHYDAAKMEMGWSAFTPKLPGFVKNLKNEVKVEAHGDNGSRATMCISADLSGIGGFLMSSFLKMNFGKTLQGLLRDLKAYAETGVVSDLKKREKSNLQ
jgi:acylphosphatase